MKQPKKKPLCRVCRSGYEQVENGYDGRPQFRCTNCKYTWSQGKDGGESLEVLLAYQGDGR